MTARAVAAEPRTQVRLSPDVHVEFLDAARAEDRAAWIRVWESWPDREVQAHPSFVALFARPGDRVVAVSARTRAGGALYPVIVRPFEREEWASPVQVGCDLTTAYSYGGPFSWNVTASENALFWAGFEVWARELRAASSFARLSLFPETQLAFDGIVLDRGPNVVRRLDLPEERIWEDYEGKVRQNVRRARREGVTVAVDFRGDRLDEFLEVYESTMDRRGAHDWYYFPRSLFERLRSDLPGRFVFLHALAGGKVVSSDLALLSERTAYYFLGGTRADAFGLRPNELVKHEMFLLCRSLGKERVVLGGGYAPDDGLLRYKRGFAPGSEARFRIGVKTHDAELVDLLVNRRAAWERALGRDWRPAEGFFPPYRA